MLPYSCRLVAEEDLMSLGYTSLGYCRLWRTETYSYDSSDRLIQVDRNNSVYQTMAYDVNGNILSKTDVGTYNYDTAKRHAVTSIDVTAGKYSPGEQSVTYNFFGKVETIGEWNGDKYHELNITYGPDMERWKSVLTTNHEEKRTVIYSDSYECVTENGQTREFYYLGENVLLVRQTGKSDMVCHAITDNQGSILCIVDDDGKRLFEAAYDAWGKQEKITNTIGFLRGYTGHEMLPEFGLINMNGRVYDPTLGRFLSPDNYVQMPDNTQSFNRYSYCINNPLKYVDPSGELFGIDDIFIAFAAFNIASSMMQAAFNGENIWKAGGLSLLSSAASYGVGAAFKEVGTFGHELLRAGAHGLSSGVVGALSGDNFFSSAASGMGASLMGSYAQVSKLSPSELIAGTTVMGGALEWATGGDFLSGAMRGLTIGALNFAEHDIIEYYHDKDGNIYGNVSVVEVPGFSI
ncbi:MAG: RHS repeat-associated core domain-containing protein [Prevotella sp.]|nr:RHS repeat-associated core domain-containing protein [Prevotella sp.]